MTFCEFISLFLGKCDSEYMVDSRKSHQLVLKFGRFFPIGRAEHRSFWAELPVNVRHGCRTLTEGLGSPFWQPRSKVRSGGYKRQPVLKQSVAIATQHQAHSP